MSSRSSSGRFRGRRAAAYVAAGCALLVFGAGLAVASADAALHRAGPSAALPLVNALVAPLHLCLNLTGRLP